MQHGNRGKQQLHVTVTRPVSIQNVQVYKYILKEVPPIYNGFKWQASKERPVHLVGAMIFHNYHKVN